MDLFQAGLITPQDALNEMSFRTGNAFITERVQAMAHAKRLLDAAKDGMQIEIFRSDDNPSKLKVFSDYLRTDDFYELPEEVQLYLRDVVVALENPNVDPRQFAQAQAMDKVFPKQATKRQEQVDAIVSAQSPMTQDQVAAEGIELSTKQGLAQNVQGLDQGAEALIGPLTGGMG